MKDGARRAGNRDLDLRLLGPLEASKGGRAVPLGGAKPRALLAALALDLGRVVSVDTLVEALWPGDTPETAAHAVQVYVSQLRKALGADTLPRRGPGYALELDLGHVDVARFTALVEDGRDALAAGDPGAAAGLLREALALWRGPALADFIYEPFAQTEIARLEELRTVALEERIEADLALGRHAELVSELEALVEMQPLRERPRAQLMLALYRSGRQADALAAYRTAREKLVDELGVEPGPDLKALEAAILRQEESLSLAEEAAAARPAMQFRRLVTILFVDVVESMALAEALDPEALGQVLREYFETVSAVLTRHGGTVEKFAGDSVMAAFGVPVTHEDDPLRAARAAIDIQTALEALNEQLEHRHGVRIDARIGIETGEVVAAQTDSRQRLVTGEAVGIAARLEQSAPAGEIVVGEVAGRLIDHVSKLEPLGELEIKGKREPVRAYRLIEIAPVAPAFQRRLDAPFTGRRRELGALRKALRSVRTDESVRAVTVIGTPGIGKSRLISDFASRARDVTALFGRCLSYGDGITYWPLREVLAEAPAGKERDAILAALEAETPPPAPEIALAFRKLCEALARERPLVLVFDDLHWAEPTFLDLVEHVADKGAGPILVVCVAREELLEERPHFLEGQVNAIRIVLDALSEDETASLLDGLGGDILDSDQRERIRAAAEGNPLFLEQLLALALEGGLAERQLPETIQALLAARLDRLGPGERAVLERAAVVGKEFSADDVTPLLDPEAAPTAGAHLRTLAGRGFVRPVREGAFRFRHVLVQEAVYRASPKRLRAELHERFADRLEEREIVDLDEFAGYHLEQAYLLRTELGETDRHTATLADDAGRRLGRAGNRAWQRNDEYATVRLLGRAVSLLPPTERSRLDMLCELAIAFVQLGELEKARTSAEEAAEAAERAGDRSRELRARLELANVQLVRDAASADALLDVARAAIPTFGAVEDHRSLGRALLLVGWAQGAVRGHYGVRQRSAERALVHYRAAGLATSSCLGEIAAALYYGPTPVHEGLALCDDLLEDARGGQLGRASVLVFKGGLEAQRGEFERGRELVESGRAVLEELGQLAAAVARGGAILGDVELLAGHAEAAERVLRETCAALEHIGDASGLASRAADLAEALVEQNLLDDAEDWIGVSSSYVSGGDIAARIRNMAVRARLAAHRSDTETGESLALEAVYLANETDALNFQGRAYTTLAEVRLIGRRKDDASEAVADAVRIFEAKGNVAAAARARELTSSPIPA